MPPVPSARAGNTNLTCPQCGERVDKLHLTPVGGDIEPDSPLTCPYCRQQFFAENALLYTLHTLDGDAYFGFPFALGGSKMRNYTTVAVGETSRHVVNNLFAGDEFETVQIRGAEQREASGDDRLPLERLGDSYTRVALGESVIVAILPVAPDELVVTANLEGGADDSQIELGDELEVVYDGNFARSSAVNPPWIKLLREAEQAILRGNPTSAVPLLVSAIDGGLYRAIYLYYLVDGLDPTEADERIRNEFGNQQGEIYTDDLAKGALKQIAGKSLSDAHGPYGEQWAEFYGEQGYQGFRHAVIHPGSEPLETVDREAVIRWFNISVSLIVGGFELLWDLDSTSSSKSC